MGVEYINPQVEPPCGWSLMWSIRGTVVEINGDSYWDLVEQLRDRLRINGEFIPEDLEDLVQRDLCSRCPDGWCKGLPGDREWFSAREIWENGTKTLNAISSVAKEERTVTQEEAERRADICVTCPKNKRVSGCWPCVMAVPLFHILLPDVQTSKDEKLFGCAACKCALKKKVHVRRELLAGDTYPSHCWMNP